MWNHFTPAVVDCGINVEFASFVLALVGIFNVVGVIFGMLDVATVPPAIMLCNRIFGRNGTVVFGWINALHQLGASGMTFAGAHIRTQLGSYDLL